MRLLKGKLIEGIRRLLFQDAIVTPDANSIEDQFYVGAGEQLRKFVSQPGGTQLPAGKSIYDMIIQNGKGYPIYRQTTFDGSLTYNLFTVTGCAIVHVIGYCDDSLIGTGGNAQCGVSGLTTAFYNSLYSNVTAGDVLALTANLESVNRNSDRLGWYVLDDIPIIVTGAATITGGTISHYGWWIPVTNGATVTLT